MDEEDARPGHPALKSGLSQAPTGARAHSLRLTVIHPHQCPPEFRVPYLRHAFVVEAKVGFGPAEGINKEKQS